MYVILILLGLTLGSFVNALVWRLHEQEKRSGSKSKQKKLNLSIWRGRSMCPNCHHELAAKDLIPVFSWLWLRGKCRYCHKAISVQYPIVELILLILFVVSYAVWPSLSEAQHVVSFIAWLVTSTGLLALCVYDLRWQLLPNKIIYFLTGVVGLELLIRCVFFDKSLTPLLWALGGVLVGGGVFYALFYISKGTWIGGGDVRLGALLGLMLGTPLRGLALIMLASLLGTLVSIPLILMKKTTLTSRMPFGPFLIIAAVLILLFASSFLTWYNHHILLLS